VGGCSEEECPPEDTGKLSIDSTLSQLVTAGVNLLLTSVANAAEALATFGDTETCEEHHYQCEEHRYQEDVAPGRCPPGRASNHREAFQRGQSTGDRQHRIHIVATIQPGRIVEAERSARLGFNLDPPGAATGWLSGTFCRVSPFAQRALYNSLCSWQIRRA
jgi:hypothetical protein